MGSREALYPLAATHRLDAAALARLEQLAGLDAEPPRLQHKLALGLGVLGATLLGLGLVFWVAANWDTLGRFGRFALLQGVVVVMGLGALWHAAWRTPLALIVLLATGALFAYFGQTYQTGADPWQLFALWAALTLPLAIGLRSEILWTPWVLVAYTALALWVPAHAGHHWNIERDGLAVHLLGWGASLLLVLSMGAALRPTLGTGPWALRTAATLAVAGITFTATLALFARDIAPHYALGILVLALLAAAFAWGRHFDVYALSAAALGLNILLVAGLGHWLFNHSSAGGWQTGQMLVLGLSAAALLAVSVQGVLRLARRHAQQRGAP